MSNVTNSVIDSVKTARDLSNNISDAIQKMKKAETFRVGRAHATDYIDKCLENLPAEESRIEGNRDKIDAQERNLRMFKSWLRDAGIAFLRGGYSAVKKNVIAQLEDNGVIWHPFFGQLTLWDLHRLLNGMQGDRDPITNRRRRIQGIRNYLFKGYANLLPAWEGWRLQMNGKEYILTITEIVKLLDALTLVQDVPFDSRGAFKAGRDLFKYNGYTGVLPEKYSFTDVTGTPHTFEEKTRVSMSNQTYNALVKTKTDPAYASLRDLINEVFLSPEEKAENEKHKKDNETNEVLHVYMLANSFEVDFIRYLGQYRTKWENGERRNTTQFEKDLWFVAGKGFARYGITKADLANGKECARKMEVAIRQMAAEKAERDASAPVAAEPVDTDGQTLNDALTDEQLDAILAADEAAVRANRPAEAGATADTAHSTNHPLDQDF